IANKTSIKIIKLFLYSVCLMLVPHTTCGIWQCFHLKQGCCLLVFLPSSTIHICFCLREVGLFCEASGYSQVLNGDYILTLSYML
uniref:Uncharacterized protein n=1 Tax=Apteryx owenii TaxID=8824 RepID=A0A8B9NY58_APTOW